MAVRSKSLYRKIYMLRDDYRSINLSKEIDRMDKAAFAVVPTDTICGRNLSSDHMANVNLWSYTSEIWIFELIFVVFRLMKNIISNKTKSFVGRNTSDHACQIFCSKSNCETMYHWFFLLEITVVKIMNNLNVCSAHNYLYPRCRFKKNHTPVFNVFFLLL